jgi:hypothetical protein
MAHPTQCLPFWARQQAFESINAHGPAARVPAGRVGRGRALAGRREAAGSASPGPLIIGDPDRARCLFGRGRALGPGGLGPAPWLADETAVAAVPGEAELGGMEPGGAGIDPCRARGSRLPVMRKTWFRAACASKPGHRAGWQRCRPWT